jgi:hypothetical protein
MFWDLSTSFERGISSRKRGARLEVVLFSKKHFVDGKGDSGEGARAPDALPKAPPCRRRNSLRVGGGRRGTRRSLPSPKLRDDQKRWRRQAVVELRRPWTRLSLAMKRNERKVLRKRGKLPGLTWVRRSVSSDLAVRVPGASFPVEFEGRLVTSFGGMGNKDRGSPGEPWRRSWWRGGACARGCLA